MRDFAVIPLSEIELDPENPGCERAPEGVDRLAQSMGEVGLLQPIGVRIHPADPKKWMVVWGERRYRAADLLGWETIDAVIVETRNVEAMRLVENEQRLAVHPLRQAEAVVRMLEQSTVWDVAKVLGEAPHRIRILKEIGDLPEEIKKAYLEERLTYEHVRLLCQVTGKEQTDLAEAWSGDDWSGPIPIARCRKDLQNSRVKLSKATWDLTRQWEGDLKLPACIGCPRNTDSELSLFSDLASEESYCTYSICFNTKASLVFDEMGEELRRSDPDRVLTFDRAKKEGFVGGSVDSPWISPNAIDIDGPLDTVLHRSKKKGKIANALKGQELDWAWIADMRELRWRRLALRPEVEKLLVKAKVVTPKGLGYKSQAELEREALPREERSQADAKKQKAERQKCAKSKETLAVAMARFEKVKPTAAMVSAILRASVETLLANADQASLERLAKVREIQIDPKAEGFIRLKLIDALRKHAQAHDETCVQLALELVVEDNRPTHSEPGIPVFLVDLFSTLGIDLKEIGKLKKLPAKKR